MSVSYLILSVLRNTILILKNVVLALVTAFTNGLAHGD